MPCFICAMMELREPKSKASKFKLEPKSSLPLVFGQKGELTKFHANLTALGSCVADPVETQMIYKMGYFGKGSLSKSHPSFGRIQHGAAPPITRKRQWQRRQEWINEVQTLSDQTFCENNKNDANLRGGGCVVGGGTNNRKNVAELDERVAEASCNTSTAATATNPSSTGDAAAAATPFKNRRREPSATEIEILNCEARLYDGPAAAAAVQHRQINKSDAENKHVVCLVDSTEEEEEEEEEENGKEVASSSSSSPLIDSPKSDCFNLKSTDYFLNELYDDAAAALNAVSSGEYNRDDNNATSQQQQQQVLVLSDSDSESENYLINIKPNIEHESFPVRETLHLTAEETFFLMYALGCLRLMDFDGKYLSIGQTWQYFCKEQSNFLQKYVTYHYFRSKGWVVKPGLNYGGDYLLYKEGPPFYHSSYIVIIDVLDATTLKRIKSVRNMTCNNSIIGLQRLAETVRKEVLVAQVLWPPSLLVTPVDCATTTTTTTAIVPTSPEILSQFSIREILVRRWKMHCLNNTCEDEQYSDNDDQDSNCSS